MKLPILKILLLTGLLTQCVVADIIYLKNGRQIEGVVLKETETHIVFQMPMGTVTYGISNIERIERNEQGDLVREEKALAENFDDDIRKLKRSVSSLYRQKGTVRLLAARSSTLEKKINDEKRILIQRRKDLLAANKALEPYAKYGSRGIPSQIYGDYMVLYQKYQSLQTEISTIEAQVEELELQKNEADGKTIIAQNDFTVKLDELNQKYLMLLSKGCPSSALSSIERSLSEHESVLERQEIPLLQRGNSYIVPVTLNHSVTKNFILDTGCSGILLNKNVATELGLSSKDSLGTLQSVIADGSTFNVDAVHLKSVTVGRFTVEDVEATVPVEGNVNSQITLLLGMSYLRHFQFSVDTDRKVLILERLKK